MVCGRNLGASESNIFSLSVIFIYKHYRMNQSQLAYLGKVCSVSYPVHHLLALGVHSSHMGPHPLPGYALDGKAGPVDVEKNPSILFLFLPRGPGAVVRGRGGGLLLGAAAEEAV